MLGPMPTDDEVTPAAGLPGRDYGDVLWTPGPEVIERARVTGYRRWLSAERGVAPGEGYPGLWRWSVERPGAFWDSVWDYFGVLGERGDGPALAGGAMPDVTWFPGATVN